MSMNHDFHEFDLHGFIVESLKEIERLFIENEIEDIEDDTEW